MRRRKYCAVNNYHSMIIDIFLNNITITLGGRWRWRRRRQRWKRWWSAETAPRKPQCCRCIGNGHTVDQVSGHVWSCIDIYIGGCIITWYSFPVLGSSHIRKKIYADHNQTFMQYRSESNGQITRPVHRAIALACSLLNGGNESVQTVSLRWSGIFIASMFITSNALMRVLQWR